MSVRHALVMALMALLLSACSSAQPPLSARQAKAVEFNQRATSAFQRGEYQTASDLYELSLQVDASIENVDGMAINLLNLARVHQALGQPERAMRYLDALLNEKALHFRTSHLASAAMYKAALQLQSGNVEQAQQSLNQAISWCTADCDLQGPEANLRAALALHNREAAQALHWAGRAVSANSKVPMEHANALRLLGQAKLLNGDVDGALVDLDRALLEDKQLGLPEKIALDLNLLAQASDKKGNQELAGHYRSRAARVGSMPK